MDEVIKHIGDTISTLQAHKSVTILKYHEAGRIHSVVLSRDIDPIVTGGIGKNLARMSQWPNHPASGDTLLRQRIRPELIQVVQWPCKKASGSHEVKGGTQEEASPLKFRKVHDQDISG
jgi:hypothetical protein